MYPTTTAGQTGFFIGQIRKTFRNILGLPARNQAVLISQVRRIIASAYIAKSIFLIN
jgi:hypothetical protein